MNNKPLTHDNGDVRELTQADFARMKPVSEVFSDLVEAQKAEALEVKPMGRPKSDNPKQTTTIRLSPEVLEYFRSTGKGWQTRMDEALKEYVAEHR